MAITSYDVGDLVRISGAFRDLSGALADPTNINLHVRKPGGTVTTITFPQAAMVRDSLGNYHSDIDIDLPGMWYYTWEISGNVQAVEAGQFNVKAPMVTIP